MEAVAIRPIDEVIREHVLKTLADNPDMAKWRIAAALSVHPNTLSRLLRKWQGEEAIVRDRR